MTGSTQAILSPFNAAVTRLIGRDAAMLGSRQIGLAVSGGPDSLALMLLANRAFPNAVRVVTVDHGLRPEAADEAAFVARLCAERGLPHDILTPDRPITGNLQSAARKVRYQLLGGWADTHGIKWVATAHHADDQLETLLMRIARGSGLAGLAAIRERNGRLIRPLLGFTKAELVSLCEDHGVVACDDPSNTNSDFDRVKIRQWLKSAPDQFDSRRTARSIAALAEAHAALEWAAAQLAPDRIATSPDGAVTLDVSGLPAELQRRLFIRALQLIDPSLSPRGETTDRALAALHAGEKLTVGDILCTGGAIWRFAAAPKRRQAH